MHKMLVSAVFCATLLSIVQSETVLPANVIWGERQPGDERLYYEIVQGKPSMLRKATKDVEYPTKGAVLTANITCIEALNQEPNSCSSVTIEKGGVGFPKVTLHFKSTRLHPFNYILQIYGKLNNGHPQPQPGYPQPQPGYPGRRY